MHGHQIELFPEKNKPVKTDTWRFEKIAARKGFSRVAGVDEAGRGPLAGPVVSAAVILPTSFSVPGITDSKKLTSKKRASLYDEIRKNASSVGIGIVDPAEIDRINILEAALLSMYIAVSRLDSRPDFLLIDGTFRIKSDIPQEPIVKGDSLSISVAAASIMAKVTRDRLMKQFDTKYPEYGFGRHKGYPTKVHREAIKRFGPCIIHRRSFKGVKEYC